MEHQLTIYNTLDRKKELFVPLHAPHVGMYVCGPTVYGDAHLGHARPAITFDVLFRYLTHSGYKVRYVRNITDVGHLEHDADDGEDSRDSVAGEDADDERDELDHLLAEDGAEHCHEESDETADDSDIDACGRLAVDCIGAFLEIADSVSCERKSDYSDGGSDNGGGHELIDPADTGNLDSYCYNNIDETREHSAENQSEIAERNGGRACESGCH